MDSDISAQYVWDGRATIYEPDIYNKRTFDQVLDEKFQPNMSYTQSMYNRSSGHNLTGSLGQHDLYNKTNDKDYQYQEEVERILIPKEYIDNLSLDYYKRKGYLQTNPVELKKYFKENSNLNKKGCRTSKLLENLFTYKFKGIQDGEEQEINFNDEDVEYSIDVYLNPKDGTTYNFFSSQNNVIKKTLKSTLFRKSKPYMTKSTNNSSPKFTKETLRRLYKNQEKLEEEEKYALNTEDFQKFFRKLLNEYYQNHNQHLTNNYEELMAFWRNIPQEEQYNKRIQWEDGEQDLQYVLANYLSDEEMIERLMILFKKFKGYKSEDPVGLYDFWDEEIKENDKYYNGLYKYNDKELWIVLNNYANYRKEEEKNQKEEEEKEKEIKKKEEEKEKKLRLIEDKDKIQKKFEELSKPKDRWRTGKVMLKLRSLFKYDNIINKMIKHEFEDNKLFRFPEEYAIRNEDQQRLVLFKNSLEKGPLTREKIEKNEEKIKELLIQRDDKDNEEGQTIRRDTTKRLKEDANLINYIKQMVIKYYKNMQNRLKTGKIESISKFLNAMYQEMLKNHKNATKRLYPKSNLSVLKKIYKYKKMHIYYPNSLKIYFFDTLKRLGKNEKGKFVFAKHSNQTFWGPSLSNNCKIHKDGCPLYCIRNTHNAEIKQQRSQNFNQVFTFKKGLDNFEKFNFWRRPELYEQKKAIFLLLSEAEHCTFEPAINKLPDEKMKIENMEQSELAERRLNNIKWVESMGNNFITKFPVIYKEGICKKAKLAFAEGRYERCMNLLKLAFNLEDVRAHFEPDYEKDLKIRRAKEREEEKQKENDPLAAIQKEHKKKQKEIPVDDFKNPKNEEICREVYMMDKEIQNYNQNLKKVSSQLKDEINIIEYNKKIFNNAIVNTKEINTDPKMSDKNPKFVYLKERYCQNFKNRMCPNKESCRNPNCQFAHFVSELKFQQEFDEKYKLRKNMLKKMQKGGKEPSIPFVMVPTGPLIYCTGCGKTFDDRPKVNSGCIRPDLKPGVQGKGLCGYCRYKQKNDLDFKKDLKAAEKANKKILEKTHYKTKLY